MKDYENKLYKCIDNQLGYCTVCGNWLYLGTTTKIDLHHKMRNTKGNRKRYPLMIDSVENLEVVHHDCHINHHGQCGKMADIEAQEIENKLSDQIIDDIDKEFES